MDFTILLVLLAAMVAPLLAALAGRVLFVPLVVFEIALGMLLGPAGLGWLAPGPVLDVLSDLGLAMLFFMAGNEIDPASLRGRTGRRAFGGWIVSAVLAIVCAAALCIALWGRADLAALPIIAIALTGTALGTIMPALRDAGVLRTPLGGVVVSAGAVGEFAPLIALSIFLGGRQPIVATLTLLAFAAVVAAAFWVARSGPRNWLRRMVTATLHTSGQFAIRFVILLLAALVALAVLLGVDFLLGAFTAGMLARVLLSGGEEAERRVLTAKLDSVAFGFLVPAFFVASGAVFPLTALLSDRTALLLVPLLALAMLLVRGLPGFWSPERGAGFSDRRTASLFTATTLPLVIAVTAIGAEYGAIDERIAAALVGAGMLTVLLFPMLALAGRGRASTGEGTDAAESTDALGDAGSTAER